MASLPKTERLSGLRALVSGRLLINLKYFIAAEGLVSVQRLSMARITVEDCLRNCKSRFELVHIGSNRTRQLMKGSRALVDNTFSQNRLIVLSLREVAAGYVKRSDSGDTAQKAISHSV